VKLRSAALPLIALGYVERVEPMLLEELDQVRAILVRVTT
jgi:hypothetical protein